MLSTERPPSSQSFSPGTCEKENQLAQRHMEDVIPSPSPAFQHRDGVVLFY